MFRLKDLRFQIDKQNGTHGVVVVVNVAVDADAAAIADARGVFTASAGRTQPPPAGPNVISGNIT